MEKLHEALPGHEAVEEPYLTLEEEGHVFAETPAVEDFELQLDRSIEDLEREEPDLVFERCPLDFVAYAATHGDSGDLDEEAWCARADEALARLDLVVFVPVETPDRIALPSSERGWRARVDRKLRELVVDRELPVDVLEVSGSVSARLDQVLRHLGKGA